MILLFESAVYETEKLRPLLGERFFREVSNTHAQIDYVGYYYQAPTAHSVLILPKVFLNKERVFAGYSATQLLDLQISDNDELKKQWQQTGKSDFLFRFSVWLYQAIKIFHQRHPDNTLTESADLQHIIQPEGGKQLSELEVINSLLHFNRHNPSLFTFIKRYNSSQKHQINWTRTAQKKIPYLQSGVPVYVETLGKQKNIDSDEELFVLFFSTLQYLSRQYGFKVSLCTLYETLSEAAFKKLLSGQGIKRLKQIRGKYFSDKMRQLWQLLYAFFDRAERTKTQQNFREVLMVKDFNIVFEDMIDKLLVSDKELSKFKNQKDGKILDHIYEYFSLLTPDDHIYHIGDSKYYREDSDLSGNSIFKQYTYARNVIQLNIDLLNKGKLVSPLHYRDDLTEGYNVTPNFFISAVIDDTLDFKNDGLTIRPEKIKSNQHFKDRLFDRDTLLLQAYNINFLYVLLSYVTQNQEENSRFSGTAKRIFRSKLIDLLNSEYDFYKLTPKEGNSLEVFISRHFRLLIGKIYRPAQSENELLLALKKEENNNRHLLLQLEQEAYLIDYNLTP